MEHVTPPHPPFRQHHPSHTHTLILNVRAASPTPVLLSISATCIALQLLALVGRHGRMLVCKHWPLQGPHVCVWLKVGFGREGGGGGVQQNFQRLLQLRQVTKVVIGSSALRVCIW
jgi:hypothetical protein